MFRTKNEVICDKLHDKLVNNQVKREKLKCRIEKLNNKLALLTVKGEDLKRDLDAAWSVKNEEEQTEARLIKQQQLKIKAKRAEKQERLMWEQWQRSASISKQLNELAEGL